MFSRQEEPIKQQIEYLAIINPPLTLRVINPHNRPQGHRRNRLDPNKIPQQQAYRHQRLLLSQKVIHVKRHHIRKLLRIK